MTKQNRNSNPEISACSWQTFAKKVKPYLLKQSQYHCSYCDIYFTNNDLSEVEHYKPKSENQYPELEFDWNNLFASCPTCNKQKEKDYKKYENTSLPIRPDENDYDFFKYFNINFLTGEISINENLKMADKSRAENTIKYLGFNKGDKPASRRRFLRNIKTLKDLPFVSYRYIVECYENELF